MISASEPQALKCCKDISELYELIYKQINSGVHKHNGRCLAF